MTAASVFVLDSRPKCGGCVHFVLNDPASGLGHCRIKPPRAFKMMMPVASQPSIALPGPQQQNLQIMFDLNAHWPPVNSEFWCGDHPDFRVWYMANRKAIRDALSAGSKSAS
jgi:hypothetical protein